MTVISVIWTAKTIAEAATSPAHHASAQAARRTSSTTSARPVIFASGAAARLTPGERHLAEAVIQKPFSLDELISAVDCARRGVFAGPRVGLT